MSVLLDAGQAPIQVETGALVLAILTALLLCYPISHFFAYTWCRWMTLGVLSSKREWLVQLPDRFGRLHDTGERLDCLSDALLEFVGKFRNDHEE